MHSTYSAYSKAKAPLMFKQEDRCRYLRVQIEVRYLNNKTFEESIRWHNKQLDRLAIQAQKRLNYGPYMAITEIAFSLTKLKTVIGAGNAIRAILKNSRDLIDILTDINNALQKAGETNNFLRELSKKAKMYRGFIEEDSKKIQKNKDEIIRMRAEQRRLGCRP